MPGLNPELAVVTNSWLLSFLLFSLAVVHVARQYPSDLMARPIRSIKTDLLDLEDRSCSKIQAEGMAGSHESRTAASLLHPAFMDRTGCKLLTCVGQANHRCKGFLQKRRKFSLFGLEKPGRYPSLLDFERRYQCGRSAYEHGHTYLPPAHGAGGGRLRK